MWPEEVDGLGVLVAVESFELMAQRAGLGAGLVLQICRSGTIFAGVADAVEPRLHAATANGKVQGAIVPNLKVRHVEWSLWCTKRDEPLRCDEVLHRRGVARSFRRQMHGQDAAKGPVEDVIS